MAKKITSVIGTIIVWMVIIVCAVFILYTLMQRQNSDNLASFFGYSPLAVQSDSMVGNGQDNFAKGDLIVVRSLERDEIKNLNVGNIIVFRDFIDGIMVLNTHRIIEVIDNDGYTRFITKGDNNPLADPIPREMQDIVAVYDGTMVAGGGKILDFLNDRWGFFALLVVPIAFFFVWRLVKLAEAVKAYKRADSEEEELKQAQSDADSIIKMLTAANVDSDVIAATLARLNKTAAAQEL